MSQTAMIRRILEYALERERHGITFFEGNAERLNHPTARGVFERLAEEERQHAQFIQHLIDQLDTSGSVEVPSILPDDTDLFMDRAAAEQLDQTVYESMVPDVTILRMAYLIERDFAEFYAQAAAKTTGEVRAALERLAHWEAGHEQLFKKLHDTLFEEYMEMPWGG